MATVVTLIPMAAQYCCPAELDGVHDTSLPTRHSPAMNLSVSCAVAAENVRYL